MYKVIWITRGGERELSEHGDVGAAAKAALLHGCKASGCAVVERPDGHRLTHADCRELFATDETD